MANEFVARKGLISLQTSSFYEDVYVSGSVYIGTVGSSSKFVVSGSGYISEGLIVDGGITGSLYGTASWAISASWASTAATSSFSETASYLNPLRQDVILTGSFNVTGSTTQIGNNTLIGNTLLSGSLTVSGAFASPTPSIKIFGDIAQSGYHRFDPVITNIDQTISASYIYVSGSTGDLYFSQNGQGYYNTTRLRWLEGNLYTGILTGGVVSGSVGATTFNVSSGSGIIVSFNATTASREPYPTIKYISWPDYTNVTPTYLNSYDTTWLLIDQNGQIIQQTSAPTLDQYNEDIQIGSLVHPNKTNISLYKTFTVTSYGVAQQTYQFIRTFGAIKVSGHSITPSGSSLSVNRSSGQSYAIGRNYVNDANTPSIVTDVGYDAPNIFRYYKSGSVFLTAIGTNTLDVGNYNTPATSTGLSALAGGQYSIQRLFFFPNQPNTLGVYYGREAYNSLSTALANLQYEPFEENNNTLTQAIFVGYIIVKSNTTDLSNTADAKFIQAGTFRNTTGGGGGGSVATSLNDLSDVAIATALSGDLLVYNGAEWQNTKTLSGQYTINGGVTGSLYGTSSLALNSISSSFSSTSSYVNTLNQSVIISGSATIVGQSGNTLLDINGDILEFTGSFLLTGSMAVTGSLSVTGLISGTASYALTASYIDGGFY